MWNEIKMKWKEQNWLKRYLCLVLVAILVTTQCTQSMGVNLVIAQTSCDSHKEHDETCGYVEAVEGQPCNHECDETCETSELKCTHSHEEGCSYAEAVEGQDCNHSHSEECGFTQDQETGEDSCTHTHDETCGYVEALDAVECDHEHTDDCYEFVENHHTHDEDCGYVEAVQGVACNHTCSECAPVGELSLTNAVFNKNPESEDYKDIEVSFSKGSDELFTIERQTVSDTEDATEREFITYDQSDDGEMVTVTLKKETLEKLEEGEHILYFSMASGVDLLFRLTVTNLQQEEEAVEEVVEEEASAASVLLTAEVTDSIPINDEYFPDPEFQKHILENFDKAEEETGSGDGVLSKEELDAVTYIDLCGDRYEGTYDSDFTHVCNHKCTNLKGIEYFENLQELYCSVGQLESLDISNNTELLILNAKSNILTELDISNNQKIVDIHLHNNNIEHFDASNHTDLDRLGLTANHLKTLDVSGCENITTLDCCDNQLTSLNVKGLGNLHNLFCDRNQLTSLDLTDNVLLKNLKCYENQLTSLDVSGKSDLSNLECQDNPLTSLNISGTKLTTLTWEGDQLTSLNASNCTSLTSLACVNNQLTTLDVTNCTALTSLDCSSNKLTNLNISTCSALTTVNASGQTLGNLPLYYEKDENDENGVWVNKALNSSERQAIFNDNTTFTGGEPENNLGLINGVLTATANNTGITPQEMSFESKLRTSDDAPVLSGTFTYTMPDKIFEVEYMDVNVAKSLETSNDLYQYFEQIVAPTPFTARTTLNVECSDFDNLNAGIPGYYPVTIFINGTTYSTAVEVGLDIDYIEDDGKTYVNFPDPKFREYVSASTIDKNQDGADAGFLTHTELNAVTKIDISGDSLSARNDYTDLTGIGYFTQLTKLYCNYCKLSQLDLSDCVNLTEIKCYGNYLTQIDLSGCSELLTLFIQINKLSSLDVSMCEKLTYLDCDDNPLLTDLNVTGCNQLTDLRCYATRIKNLDVSNKTALTKLDCYNTQLTSLDVSGCTSLNSLNCTSSPLKSIDISGTALTSFKWENGQLTSLNAKNCPSLTELDCSGNSLTSLDISGSTLASLDCSGNKLTNVIIGKSAPESFEGSNQNLGVLAMYYDGENYVNSAKNSRDVVRAFEADTIFKKEASSEGNLNKDGAFYLNNGALTIAYEELDPGEVYYELDLGANAPLSGTFEYNIPILSVSNGYIDVNDAKALQSKQEILELGCFAIDIAPAPLAARSSYTIDCDDEDFAAIKTGTLGQYDVTIAAGETIYNTVLEVGLDIDYTEDEGDTYINFPDSKFREYVSSATIDTNQDGDNKGFLTLAELNAVTKIDISGNSLSARNDYTDLTGIGYFTQLKKLECNYCKLSQLDLSDCVNLTDVRCYGNYLTKIDLSGCSELHTLFIQINRLSSLDVSMCEKLAYLDCDDNPLLTDLNVTGCNQLTDLRCYATRIKKLDVSNKTALTYLACYNTQLTSLDVSGCTSLNSLNCTSSPLKSIDISGTALTSFKWENGQLTSLNAKNCPSLTELDCSGNSLTSLDISGSTLASLDCSGNKLTNVIIGKSAPESFEGSNQNLGVLAMYYDGENYVNSAKNSRDVVRAFEADTIFKKEASSEANLNKDGAFYLNNGALTIAYEELDPGEVYYELDLGANAPLSGTFEYNIPILSVSDGYVDVNDAKALRNVNDILALECFAIETAPTPELLAEETTDSAYCSDEDFAALKAGTLGKYDVTLTLNGVTYDTSIIVGVDIDEKNFPDKNFRTFVKQYDTVNEGREVEFLTQEELNEVKEIIISGQSLEQRHNYKNLTGIEYFTNLETLKCSYGYLTSLNLSNPKLNLLECYWNELASVNLKGCENLVTLRIQRNPLTNLDVSGLVFLDYIDCDNDQLVSLDVSGCTSLRDLTCYGNNLTTLDLSENTALKTLLCYDNDLKRLELGKNVNLQTLNCWGNELSSLDIDSCIELTTLRCNSNQLEKLNISNNKKLITLKCQDNQLSNLNITGLTNLSASSFDASNQSLGTISMYQLATGSNTWVNEAQKTSDLTRNFGPNTITFYDNATMTSDDALADFGVNTTDSVNYVLTVTNNAVVPMIKPVYFKTVLDTDKGISLSGSFAYNLSTELSATTGYIDVNDAKRLATADAILSNGYIKLSGTATKVENMSYSVECPELSSIRAGIPGQYEVTVQGGDYICTTTLEVGVYVNNTNFPDSNFRTFVTRYDESKEGLDVAFLTKAELDEVIEINIAGDSTSKRHNYKDLTGIEYFQNLETLKCSYGYLTSLNLSNPKLNLLECYFNELASVNIRGCKNLVTLRIQRNPLTSLDVSGLVSLDYIDCDNAQLVSLDVSGCTSLRDLTCYGNSLTTLDLSENTALEILQCYDNDLKKLELGKNVNLQRLQCWGNELSSLDIDSCTELTLLRCYSNQLEKLNISNNKKLITLQCQNNRLTSLDITGLNLDVNMFDASNQNIGTMALYYNTTTEKWVNESRNERYVYSEFNPYSNTNFYSDSSSAESGTPLSYFTVDSSTGALVATDDAPISGSIYFVSQAGKTAANVECVLEGTIKYIRTSLSVTDGYIDVNEAKGLMNEEALLTGDYFKVTKNEQNSEIDIEPKDLKISISPADFTNIKNGVPGQYPITIKHGELFAETVLEVGVDIQYYDSSKSEHVNFPDKEFREYVGTKSVDINQDEFLTLKELEAVTVISIEGTSADALNECKQLDGIQYFGKLKELHVAYCQLSSLNIEQNTELTHLNVEGNSGLSSINVDLHTNLTSLNISSTGIKTVNLNGNTKLKNLNVANNGMESLDVSGNTRLEELSCYNNALQSLDLSTNTALILLRCNDNALTNLDLSKNRSLSGIYCGNNKLSSLDITGLRIGGFDATGQNIENLPMYYDAASGVWINEAKNASEISRKFAENTLFKQGSSAGTSVDTIFEVNDNGSLTANSVELEFTQVYFQSAMYDAGGVSRTLSGTFTYTIPAVIVANGYVDVNEAGSLTNSTLSKYFTVTPNSSSGGSAPSFSVEVATDDLRQMNNKKLGQYSACISIGEEEYPTVLELGVDIDYQKDSSTDVFDNFPDQAFRTHVELYDTEQVGEDAGFLTAAELEAVTIISIAGKSSPKGNYASLTGIKYFTNLETLKCQHNILTALKLENNLKLKYLDCGGNRLESLELDSNTELTYLGCGTNRLTELDVSANTKLTYLDISHNESFAGVLDVSKNPLLDTLNCHHANLTELDINNNPKLTTLYCNHNNLTELDLRNNSLLETIRCQNNKLTSLDISGCTGLSDLKVDECSLTELDVSKNPSLTLLSFWGNQIQTIDLSNNNLLDSLHCNDNQLTELDISCNTLLTELDCDGNKLTSLDLTNCPLLTTFSANDQKVENLAMYYDATEDSDGTDKWINIAKNANDIVAKFNLNTTFSNDASLSVSDDGVLKTTSGTSSTGDVSFSSVLREVDENTVFSLNGTITYIVPEVAVTTGYVDINDAGSLTAEKLINEFTVTENSADGTEVTGLTIDETKTDLNNIINNGIGRYDVTLKKGSESYITALEVGVDIDKSKTTADGTEYLNFPDPEFRSHVETYDKEKVGEDARFLTAGELDEVTEIDIHGPGHYSPGNYQNLKGIEYFTELKKLACHYNNISKLDVSKNTKLVDLDCGVNKLTGLDLSNNTELESLQCGYNDFSSAGLDLSANTKLTLLHIGVSKLKNLDVSKNTALKELYCFVNNLEELKVNNNQKLDILHCYDNALESLDLSDNTLLTELKCSNNVLDQLILSENPSLSILYCSNNYLNELNLSSNTSLKEVYCDFNQLTNLDVTNLKSLTNLSCTGNYLTSLNIDGLTNLTMADASDQVIEVLSMDHNGIQWTNAIWQSTDVVRDFMPNVTMFRETSSTGTELTSFDVNDKGVLTASTLFPITEKVYFESTLRSGKSWKLTGTFAYYPVHALSANTLVFTPDDIASMKVAGKLADVTVLKTDVDGLFTVAPTKDANIADAIVVTMEAEAFAELAKGTVGTYDYQAKLTLPLETYTQAKGQIVVVDAVKGEDDSTSYINANSFFIGASSVTAGLTKETVLQRSSVIYHKEDAEGNILATHTYEDADEFMVTGNTPVVNITAPGTYTLTISHTAGALSKEITVTVVDDNPSELIVVPANIELSNEDGENIATAESYVRLIENAEQVLEGVVNVFTDESIELQGLAGGVREVLPVYVYGMDDVQYDNEEPLAALTSTKTEQKFKLKSGDLSKLRGKSYVGVLEFTVSYVKEGDDSEN